MRFLSLSLLTLMAFTACKRPNASPVPTLVRDAAGLDASMQLDVTLVTSDTLPVLDATEQSMEDVTVDATRDVIPMFVDYELPDSSASGPEAARARNVLITLRLAIGFWRIDAHAPTRCPTLEDLASTRSAGFDRTTMMLDPWNHPYEIRCRGAVVTLRSLGADGVADTSDDIWSH